MKSEVINTVHSRFCLPIGETALKNHGESILPELCDMYSRVIDFKTAMNDFFEFKITLTSYKFKFDGSLQVLVHY